MNSTTTSRGARRDLPALFMAVALVALPVVLVACTLGYIPLAIRLWLAYTALACCGASIVCGLLAGFVTSRL